MRVLDGDALGRRDAEQFRGAQIGIRCRLAFLGVAGGDDEAEGGQQAAAGQHQIDLMAQRARRDGERPVVFQPPHARRGARIQHVFGRHQRLEAPRFLLQQHFELLVAQQQTVVRRDLPERPLVVESEVTRAVLLLGQPDAVRRQDVLVAAEVQRLRVGENTVEVEDDSANGTRASLAEVLGGANGADGAKVRC